MESTTKIQIRFVDLDAYNHVNNSVYLSYLEVARVDLIHDLFLADMKRGIQYLLIKIELSYKQPIHLTDELYVRCWFSEIGKVKFKVSYELHDGKGHIFSTGYSVHALFNTATGKPMRVPESWQEFQQD